MANQKIKKVWDTVSTAADGDGFAVLLNDQPLRTPAKSLLIAPTQGLAAAIAFEWDTQDEFIHPQSMPLTRTANSAIDKVAPQKSEVAKTIAEYGDSDLICYRAESPAALVSRQKAAWDPILEWAQKSLGATLEPRTGIIHVSQDPAGQSQLASRVNDLTIFELAGFHDLVALSGSLVLAFAAKHGHLPPDQIWAISRIDEAWQMEQWGADEQAVEQDNIKKSAFMDAEVFVRLSRKKA